MDFRLPILYKDFAVPERVCGTGQCACFLHMYLQRKKTVSSRVMDGEKSTQSKQAWCEEIFCVAEQKKGG